MEFKTVENVEIVGTGTYPLGSGETTFTAEDLKGAVLASSDPTVPKPRLGIGHTDPRFADDLDGEPALGTATNLRLSDDGQKIVADFENVPAWLAEAMPSAYPSRSIEGAFGFEAPSKRKYPLAISAVKLLGQVWPGVTSLKDLKDTLSANGPTPEAVTAASGVELLGGKGERFVSASMPAAAPTTSTGTPPIVTRADLERVLKELAPSPDPALKAHVTARAKALNLTSLLPDSWKVAASLDVGGLPRKFATDLTAGKVPGFAEAGPQVKWWTRSVEASDGGAMHLIVDDDAGHLLRLPIEVTGDAVTYGAPELVKPTVAPIAASADIKGPRVLASWPAKPERVEAKMEVEPAVLRKRLGLAEDADEAAISAALAAEPKPDPAKPAASSSLPEGVVAIDEQTLTELRSGAKAGSEVAASLAKVERDNTIKASIEAGKIAASRREHYEKSWDHDAEGTKAILASLEPGLIPASQREIGRSGTGEGAESEDAIVAAFERQFFPELAQTTNGGAS